VMRNYVGIVRFTRGNEAAGALCAPTLRDARIASVMLFSECASVSESRRRFDEARAFYQRANAVEEMSSTRISYAPHAGAPRRPRRG
jgi:hypothetical protein